MAGTKDIILNTAERLFAEKGYHNTSTRELTGDAGVNLSAINYHFGSKEKLFEAVITRRLVPINTNRMAILADIIATCVEGKSKPDVRELLNAFFGPVWTVMVEDENAKYFMMMMAGIMHDSDNTLRNKFFEVMKPVALAFFEQACNALPELDEKMVLLRVQLSMGAFFLGAKTMFHTENDGLQNQHAPLLPDKDAYFNELIEYITRGIKG